MAHRKGRDVSKDTGGTLVFQTRTGRQLEMGETNRGRPLTFCAETLHRITGVAGDRERPFEPQLLTFKFEGGK